MGGDVRPMISKIRKAIFWLHLAVGVAAGLFILSMAVSGVSIAYERQVTAWTERGQRTVAVPVGAQKLGVEALTARVQEQRPDARLSGVTLYADPAASAVFNLGREEGVILANPYSGDVIGQGSPGVRAFFHFMTGWHRWLATEGAARPWGQGVTGAATLCYFVLLLTGLCVWLPRRWSWRNLRPITLLRRGLQGKARDWNWHNVVGIWSVPLLLVVTLTGIVMGYSWANDLLFRATGSPPPEQRGERNERGGPGRGSPGGLGGERGEREDRRGGRGKPEGGAPRLDLAGTDALWDQAAHRVEGWRSITLRFGQNGREPVTFNIDRGDGARPDLKAQLVLDRRTGETTRWQPYASQNTGQKLRQWTRFVHTGEAGGWFGQTIAAVAACGGGLLVWTGLSLSWRRFFGRRAIAPEADSSMEQAAKPPV